MTLNAAQVGKYLRSFDLQNLFLEELGWDRLNTLLPVSVDGHEVTLRGFAEKRGVQVFECPTLPDYRLRRLIEKQVARSAVEHLIVFRDEARTTQVWQWVARGPAQPDAYREHSYTPARQAGDALIQKLDRITIPLSEEEALDLTGTVHRLRDAFDRDKVTKKFFDHFQKEHKNFLAFIDGIEAQSDRAWYASLMLNRLMFIYFIQKKGFLDGNPDYLRDRLKKVQERRGRGKFQTFFQYFLLRLFHDGFAKQPAYRKLDADLTRLLGDVPYLNGGLFDVHDLERRYPKIDLPDEAFERLFNFFDQYDWTLDTRPLSNDREINPDVLGYIFEKYINQKQMGAYYTKEDITEYIGKNTIVPFLFDAAERECKVAFDPKSALWRLLTDDADRYIYPAVRKGVIDDEGQVIPLPPEIEKGVNDVSKRGGWNRAAAAPYNLPTETWREHVARRQRCLELRDKLRRGEIHRINDLVTWNLNVRQFAEDAIDGCEGPELLKAFYYSIAGRTREENSTAKARPGVSVLDPTCGSGAFLFAALNILQPLYEACLDRMQAFVDDQERVGKTAGKNFKDFRKILEDVGRHPNRDYFIVKSIIVHNLYGVDIMEEAVEICKLRLFLKLVAQIDRVQDLEPLPDIDFNIRAGNTLIGFATFADVERSINSRLDFDKDAESFREEAEMVERSYRQFHDMQTMYAVDASQFAMTKQELRQRLDALCDQLDLILAGDYHIDSSKPRKLAEWQTSHQPFHWFAEFYGIMKRGGFDVIIGNPPFVEYVKVKEQYTVRGFQTTECGNLYAFVMERCYSLTGTRGRVGLISPLSLVCTDRMSQGRKLLQRGTLWLPCFDIRPSALFEGVAQRLTFVLMDTTPTTSPLLFSGGYRRWAVPERQQLLPLTRFAAASWADYKGPVQKVADALETEILRKLSGPGLSSVVADDATPIYIHRICRYFIKGVDFIPYFRDADGKKGKSEDYKPFGFLPEFRETAVCYVNSTLFYWLWRCHGDGFHCGYGDVYRVPLGQLRANSPKGTAMILADRLMGALKDNSERKSIRTKRGEIVYQEFSPKPTKPILDEIDTFLGARMGLAPEELDFIINYDIKYRMGQDDGEDAE